MKCRGWRRLLRNRFSKTESKKRRPRRGHRRRSARRTRESRAAARLRRLTNGQAIGPRACQGLRGPPHQGAARAAGCERYVSFVGTELRERGAAGLFERGWRCYRKGGGGRHPLGARGCACRLRRGRSKRRGGGWRHGRRRAPTSPPRRGDRASEGSRRAGTARRSSSFWLRSVRDRRQTRSPTTSRTERSSGVSRQGGQPWPQAGEP